MDWTVDWTGVLDRWTGLVDWTSGLDQWTRLIWFMDWTERNGMTDKNLFMHNVLISYASCIIDGS